MRGRRHRPARGARAGRRRWLLAPVLGLLATLASSVVNQRTTARFEDIDGCIAGCEVAAAGWPLPYLVDYPGLSPGNDAALIGLALGVDRLRPEAFVVDLLAWTVLAAVLAWLLGRARR